MNEWVATFHVHTDLHDKIASNLKRAKLIHAGCLQIDAVLAYLKDDLELGDEDVQKVVKKFPEVVNLDVEKRLKANIAHMEKVVLFPVGFLQSFYSFLE